MAAETPNGGIDNEARRCFIQAFKELYPANGMKGISGAALAKRAGYSRSTFYRNFESVYDVLRLVEIEATPYRRMNYLVEHADEERAKWQAAGVCSSCSRESKPFPLLIAHLDRALASMG